MRVDVTEEQTVRTKNCTTSYFENTINIVRFSRSHFLCNKVIVVLMYVAQLSLCTCVFYNTHVRKGVCESPWTGRLPPQGLHPWSTGCVLQVWLRGSHRSGCMESQPSAGAPGNPQPLGPQEGLEERHVQIYTLEGLIYCLQVCLHA